MEDAGFANLEFGSDGKLFIVGEINETTMARIAELMAKSGLTGTKEREDLANWFFQCY